MPRVCESLGCLGLAALFLRPPETLWRLTNGRDGCSGVMETVRIRAASYYRTSQALFGWAREGANNTT